MERRFNYFEILVPSIILKEEFKSTVIMDNNTTIVLLSLETFQIHKLGYNRVSYFGQPSFFYINKSYEKCL